MTIKDWPKNTRPREKLLQMGAAALSDTELLAVCLGTGNRQQNALELANHLIQTCGNLPKVFQASPTKLRHITGMGTSKIAILYAALELGKRYLNCDFRLGEKINGIDSCRRFLQTQLHDKVSEVFSCIFLTNQQRILAYEELFHGTIHEAQIYPREILRRCLFHNAAKIILAHNHPSGAVQPSEADKTVTETIQHLLSIVDIHVLDHFIIAHHAYFSFAEAGYL